MRAVITLAGIVAGIAAILALWSYNPGFAILCVPLAASCVVALASILKGADRGSRRHRSQSGAPKRLLRLGSRAASLPGVVVPRTGRPLHATGAAQRSH